MPEFEDKVREQLQRTEAEAVEQATANYHGEPISIPVRQALGQLPLRAERRDGEDASHREVAGAPRCRTLGPPAAVHDQTGVGRAQLQVVAVVVPLRATDNATSPRPQRTSARAEL